MTMTRYRSWPPRSTSVLQKWCPTMPLPITTRVSATPRTSGTGGMVSSRRMSNTGTPPSKNLRDGGGIANYLAARFNPRDLFGSARLVYVATANVAIAARSPLACDFVALRHLTNLVVIVGSDLDEALRVTGMDGQLRREDARRDAAANPQRRCLDELRAGVADHLRAEQPFVGCVEHQLEISVVLAGGAAVRGPPQVMRRDVTLHPARLGLTVCAPDLGNFRRREDCLGYDPLIEDDPVALERVVRGEPTLVRRHGSELHV